MSINVKNYIIEKIKEQNPNIDTREGSVFRDVLINPLSSILGAYQTEHDDFIKKTSITDLTTLSKSDLDAVASNFLVTRNQGSYSSGYIKLYFNEPRPLSIPVGTIFTAGTYKFQTTTPVNVTKFQMEQNVDDYPNYDSGPILVRAVLPGSEYNIPENTSLAFVGSIDVSPIRIVSTTAFTGGEASESNTTFFNRLKDSVHNKSLASPYAIKARIMETFPTVKDVSVIGSGHPFMIRDLTSLVEDVSNYKDEDFNFTYSGQHSGTYDKKHLALTGNFIDIDESEGIALPMVTGWTQEFSNSMYEGIYKQDDASYAEQVQYIIVREFFEDLINPESPQPDLAIILNSGNWQVHDGINPTQNLFYVDQISVVNKKLKMGKTLNPNDVDAMIAVPLSQLSGIYDLVGSNLAGTTESAFEELGGFLSPFNFNNTAPIFHKQIDQHLGIQIDFTFATTDGTETGEMAYATVLRNSEIYAPQDGYGIAFRKQPGFLLRMEAGTQTADDLTTFSEHYNMTEAEAAAFVGNIKSNSAFWKYNVYLVDNDILQEEVWVGHDQLWDQTSGRNQFLQAAKVWIEPNLTYQVRCKVYPKLAFDAWVFDYASPPSDPYSEAKRVLNRGTTYPPYVPQSGDNITTDTGLEILSSARNHFGLAIAQTRNYEWTFDDLQIKSFVETFPMHLFRLKMAGSGFDYNGDVTIKYYGVGYDPVQYALDGDTGNSKTKALVWNATTDAWQSIGSHINTIDDARPNQLIAKSLTGLGTYVDSAGFLNIAAHAANSGADFADNVEHALRSYYVKIDNTNVAGVHRGNAMDIYVHDPGNILLGSASVTLISEPLKTKEIPGIAPYIQEIVEVREGISKVAFDSNSYTIGNLDKGSSYSSKANYSIDFDLDDLEGAQIEVVYRYWSNGSFVSNLLNQSSNQYPAADQVVKIMPPTVIQIDKLEYSGGLNEDSMKVKLSEYFNGITGRTFDKSDIISVLYDNGSSFVNTDMTIYIREYDTEAVKTAVRFLDQRYIMRVDVESRFFSSIDDLAGVTQI